jgi:hypothetical protein
MFGDSQPSPQLPWGLDHRHLHPSSWQVDETNDGNLEMSVTPPKALQACDSPVRANLDEDMARPPRKDIGLDSLQRVNSGRFHERRTDR